jgi:transposase
MAPGTRGSWAQVWDVRIIRHVIEYLLPMLRCAGCGTVPAAQPPAGAQAGAVRYGFVLNTAAVLLTAFGNVPPERAARLIGMLLQMPVSAGFVGRAGARLSGRLEAAGFDDAMREALAAEPVLGPMSPRLASWSRTLTRPPARLFPGRRT